MAKKVAKKSAKSAPKSRQKKTGMRPIGESLESVADEIQAQARDAFKPDVQRGDNVDVVNGRWKTTTKDQLGRIARAYESQRKTSKTASGDLAEIIAKGKENKNLDPWCFKKAMDWFRLGDELLVRRLPVFLKYLDDLGVSDRSTAQADLLDAADKPPPNVDDEPEGDGQTDVEDVISDERRREEAAAAATGLAPSRRPRGLRVVPTGDDAAPASSAPVATGGEPATETHDDTAAAG